MSKEDDTVIAKALEQIDFHAGEIIRLKLFVNQADKISQREPRFDDIPDVSGIVAGAGSTRHQSARGFNPGTFLGKPFAAAARAVLVARYEAAGKEPSPASVEQIQEALVQGTYDFGTNNSDAQKQSIRISLGKNSLVFVRLPNTELFGLMDWYPRMKRIGKTRRASGNSDSPAAGGDE